MYGAARRRRRRLLHGLEALAVGALVNRRVSLVGTDLDALQTAVCLTSAVVGALLDATTNRAIGGASTAVLSMVHHRFYPPCFLAFGVCQA